MTGQKWSCPTCGVEVRGWLIGRTCNACELEGICKMLVARAEQAERERDEARAQALQAERDRDEARGFAVYAEAELYVGVWTGYFRACSPAGLLGQDGSWDGRTPAKRFATAVEAEKAGRAVPWWEVKA